MSQLATSSIRERRKRIDVRLGGGTDTRDGKTDVDSGTNTTEEELGLQEDLTISDGNDLCIYIIHLFVEKNILYGVNHSR